MSETTIRPVASAGELAQAIEVVRSQFDPPLASDGVGAVDLYDNFENDSGLCLVAVRRGELLGGALGFRSSATQAMLRVLAVSATQRGVGLGRALLERFEAGAAGLGVDEITLGTNEAAEFYVHCGWTPLLLLQWVHDATSFETEAAAVLASLGSGLPTHQSSYKGVPQLFIELPSADRKAVRSAAELARGAHAGFVMSKRLRTQA